MGFKQSFLIFLILGIWGCTSTKLKTEPNSNFKETASDYMIQYLETCQTENTDLWEKSLCVPLVFIDRESQLAVASQKPPGRLFDKRGSVHIGQYEGPQLFANTSFKWGGQNWSMVLWPLPEGSQSRNELIFHEAWHSIQEELGFPTLNIVSSHLDQEKARVLIRLEWNALLAALREKDQALSHLKRALTFRALRFKEYPGAQNKEETMELNEGLAAYTGVKFRNEPWEETLNYLKQNLEEVPSQFSITRSAAYYSGRLYGLLLDTQKQNWKKQINQKNAFSNITAQIFGVELSSNFKLPSGSALEAYDYQNIIQFEKERAKSRANDILKYMKKAKGGFEIFPSSDVKIMFDPRGILAINERSFVYKTMELNDQWGVLKVQDGVLVDDLGEGKMKITLGKPDVYNESSARGDGWSLELEEGWILGENNEQGLKITKKN